MKFGTMLRDILESFTKKPATRLYPAERVAPPQRYRGRLYYSPQQCTGCRLCVMDCPSKAIELVILDRAAKRYVLKYHIDRCIYCGQCVVNCKFKCIGLSNEDWENALVEKCFGTLYGKDEDIAAYLENAGTPGPEPAKA